MCEYKHKHNPSQWAGSWKAVKEFWKCSADGQEKDWHCAVCGAQIEKPNFYHINYYLSLIIYPFLFSIELQAFLPFYKIFPSPVVAAVYCGVALYFSRLLEFRIIPVFILSFGKWNLKSANQRRVFLKGKTRTIFRIFFSLLLCIASGIAAMAWFLKSYRILTRAFDGFRFTCQWIEVEVCHFRGADPAWMRRVMCRCAEGTPCGIHWGDERNGRQRDAGAAEENRAAPAFGMRTCGRTAEFHITPYLSCPWIG